MKKLAFATFFGIAAALGLMAPGSPAEAQTQKSAKSGQPLKGVVRPARRGGYSYKYVQGINTRKFTDPRVTEQSPSGPFDSGFWFESPGVRHHGGDAPYMQ